MTRTDPRPNSLSYRLFGVKLCELSPEQRRAYNAEWRRLNRDKVLASRKRERPARLVRLSDPVAKAAKREYDREWRARNPDRIPAYYRKYRLKREFGITIEQYDAMLAAQGGKCAICERTESQLKPSKREGARLHVDHDHATGKVRGLLCHHCNMVLGHLDDNIERMRTAIRYLEFYRRQHGAVVSAQTEVVTGVPEGVVVVAAQRS